jgi:hypothetical protein
MHAQARMRVYACFSLGVHPNGENGCVPSKSLEFTSFPDGHTVFSWPLSQMFVNAGDKVVTPSTQTSFEHSRDATLVPVCPWPTCNGG